MKTLDFYNTLEPYRMDIIRYKTEGLRSVINHLKNSSGREYREYYGYTKESNIEQFEKELSELINNNNTPLKYLGISKSEALNYLRAEAYSRRRRAINFSGNPLIVMQNLRKAVKIAQTLIKAEPKLEIYSLHWLINSTPITIT